MKTSHVLIVGGGSAGWMTAAYLNAVLNRKGRRPVKISLIESPDDPRIGVGEATIPTINALLAAIGIDEIEFLKRVDGTYKQAIKYVNWVDGTGDSYYHTFGRAQNLPLDTTSFDWLTSDRSIPFCETVTAQAAVCELGLAPKDLEGMGSEQHFPYAFHLNALKFADYLMEFATARGVTHHLDKVVDVEVAASGDISSVKTRSGEVIEADLFVDCTGFFGLLIDKTLKTPWVDWSQWLLCDGAVVVQVPYETSYPGQVRPNTVATAVSSGWIWEIPLQNRRAWGYVHSSGYIDKDAAERELREFVGPIADNSPARYVPFRVGYRSQPWTRNCIAIGLSSGFVEPLESTGLHMSEVAATLLAEHFPYGGEMERYAYRFNRLMVNRYHEVLDFINMHYCLTRRTDTEFWREIGKPERVTDRLAAKLEFWRQKPPGPMDFEDQWFPGKYGTSLPNHGELADVREPVDNSFIFPVASHEAILYGMDFLRDECDEWFGTARPPSKLQPQVARRLQYARDKLPRHDVWLQRLAGMPQFPQT